MGEAFYAFLLVMVLLAVLTRETFVVILFYLFAGASLLGRWWSNRLITHIQFTRKFDNRAFPGENIPVQLEIRNPNWLPAIWLRVQDLYPLEIADLRTFQKVVSLGPNESTLLQYTLKARKRGYYAVGPLGVSTGDLLGLSAEKSSQGAADHLTVYPTVIPLSDVRLPSRSPMGTLRTRQPVFEDPTRSIGKRDYHPGDSLRRIDWKASAVTGRLQTKLFEPSISLETMIFLNLNLQDYALRARYDASELAIVIAASVANWIVAQRQAVGLVTNGIDPLSADHEMMPLPARKGRAHMMRMLELLARVRALETTSFSALIGRQRVHLSWGTTLVVISNTAPQALFDELVHARHSGLIPVLILCGENPGHRQAVQVSKLFKIPVFEFRSEKDLDIWR